MSSVIAVASEAGASLVAPEVLAAGTAAYEGYLHAHMIAHDAISAGRAINSAGHHLVSSVTNDYKRYVAPVVAHMAPNMKNYNIGPRGGHM